VASDRDEDGRDQRRKEMTRSTNRRFAAAALTAAALTIAVPVAQAQSPDAFERAVRSQEQSNPTFVGTPDAVDRAIAAREARQVAAAIEARERALTERPSTITTHGPDAFERAVITHTDAMNAQTVSMLDSRERALSGRPSVSSPGLVASGEGFEWSEFGMGAGAAIGLVLIAGLGALALRRSGRVTTA
jgi:hypothetical protein